MSTRGRSRMTSSRVQRRASAGTRPQSYATATDAYELARRLAATSDPRPQSIRVDAFDPGLMLGMGLARTYSEPLRFVWKYLMPIGTLFYPDVNSPAKSGRRLALLVAGQLGSTTAKYLSNGREIPSSELSYDTANTRDHLWDTSAEMTKLPRELDAFPEAATPRAPVLAARRCAAMPGAPPGRAATVHTSPDERRS